MFIFIIDIWTDGESSFMLDRYKKYIAESAPMKRFKTRKSMWLQIAKELKDQFKVDLSHEQLANRFV